MKTIIDEITQVSRDLQIRDLSANADTSPFESNDLLILQQINTLLDTIVLHFSLPATYLDKLSKGKLPPEIIGSYNDEINEIVTNLNRCIKILTNHTKDTAMIKKISSINENHEICETNFGWNVICGLPQTEEQYNQIEGETQGRCIDSFFQADNKQIHPKEDTGWGRLCELPD
jgi:hypothetical protein